MTNLTPVPAWDDVRQLEANEYATGGAGGNMNEQALALTARTGYLDKYTASPYRTGKVYDLNERVQLESGDIVKSTVANNTANPNSNMTGWVKINDASQIFDVSGKTQQEINYSNLSKIPSLKDYGAKYSGSDDKTYFDAAKTANAHLLVNGGEVSISTFINNIKHVYGLGYPVVNVNPDVNVVSVQLLANSITENVKFNSTNNNKEWQRATMQSNTIARNCGFHNFGHISALPNSWGIYLAQCENIVIDTCEFSGNSQSDIALVDDVKDVVVINPRHTIDPDGVTFNIEPNDIRTVEGVNVIGGKYKRFYLLENFVTSNTIKAVSVSGARIKEVVYKGGGVTFNGCTIQRLMNFTTSYIYCGELKIDNATLSKNLLRDPYLSDIGLSGNTAWTFYEATGNEVYRRVKSDDGHYTLLNPNLNSTPSITNADFIDVTGETDLIICFTKKNINPAGYSAWQAGAIRFYDSLDVQIGSQQICTNRVPVGTNSEWCNDVGVITLPANTVKVKLNVSCPIQCQTMISHIGLYKFKINQTNGNFNSTIEENGKPKFIDRYQRTALPTGTRLNTYKIGDIIEVKPTLTSDGTVVEYIATSDSTWSTNSTWMPISIVSRRQVWSQAYAGGTIAANSSSDEIVVPATGIIFGDRVLVSLNVNLQGCYLVGYVSANNNVKVRFVNPTASPVTLAAGIIKVESV